MTETNNFQRIGVAHNAGVGVAFEGVARKFFLARGINLVPSFAVEVGISIRKKRHRFDLGSADPAVLVECKSHRWTSGGNVPVAKLTVWNEATYYFHVAPKEYRKIMFVLKHDRREQSLAAYYIHTHGHLVPDGVEIWEFNEEPRPAFNCVRASTCQVYNSPRFDKRAQILDVDLVLVDSLLRAQYASGPWLSRHFQPGRLGSAKGAATSRLAGYSDATVVILIGLRNGVDARARGYRKSSASAI